MWAAKAAKLGFRWKIGDGKKVKFWEDNWLGNSSLAIQFFFESYQGESPPTIQLKLVSSVTSITSVHRGARIHEMEGERGGELMVYNPIAPNL